MNTIEAAALRAVKPYYLAHWEARRDDPAGLSGPCQCEACRHARYLFELLGVHPSLTTLPTSPESTGSQDARLSA